MKDARDNGRDRFRIEVNEDTTDKGGYNETDEYDNSRIWREMR